MWARRNNMRAHAAFCLIAVLSLSTGAALIAQGRSGSENIAVHGHWTITVRDGDGSVASRSTFENSLSDQRFLSGLLFGRYGATFMDIQLLWQNVNDSLEGNVIPIEEALSGEVPGPGRNLTKVVNGNALELSGSAIFEHSSPNPAFTAWLTIVRTFVYCAGCTTTAVLFTQRDLSLPADEGDPVPPKILIRPGQTVDVIVSISFGPAH